MEYIPCAPDLYKDGNIHWDNSTGSAKIYANAKDDYVAGFGYLSQYAEIGSIPKATSTTLSDIATNYPKMVTANAKGVTQVWLTDVNKMAYWTGSAWVDAMGNTIS